MKFRYYITNLHEGLVQGTDDETIAANCATSEDFFVVDTETGIWLGANNDQTDIQELKP